MATMTQNKFTSYRMTDEEQLQGGIFTTLQLQGLQNLLADYAEQKILLEPPVENYSLYIQEEAKCSARIQLLEYLISNSEAAVFAMEQAARGDSGSDLD